MCFPWWVFGWFKGLFISCYSWKCKWIWARFEICQNIWLMSICRRCCLPIYPKFFLKKNKKGQSWWFCELVYVILLMGFVLSSYWVLHRRRAGDFGQGPGQMENFWLVTWVLVFLIFLTCSWSCICLWMLLALATTYCACNGFPFAFVHNWIMVKRDAYVGLIWTIIG